MKKLDKIKSWLKNKLRIFLGISTLEKDLKFHKKATNERLNLMQRSFKVAERGLREDISHFQQSVNVLHSTVENVVHIGTDIREPKHRDGHSWAVVCVEGKINIVKFIELGNRDARDILDFLKHFEAGRHCIDTPHKMFFNELFKF